MPTKKIKTETKSIQKFFSGKHLTILVFSLLLLIITPLIWYISKRIFVARVNGQPITRLEFYQELEKADGQTVLDDMITKKIIFQEAKKQGVVVTDQDVQNELSNINASIEAQGSTLDQVLTYQGVTKDQLIENIRIEKILEVLLKDQIQVSDDEVKQYYDDNKSSYPSTQTFDQLKNQIKQEVYQNKIQGAYSTWISQIRAKAVVEKYL